MWGWAMANVPGRDPEAQLQKEYFISLDLKLTHSFLEIHSKAHHWIEAGHTKIQALLGTMNARSFNKEAIAQDYLAQLLQLLAEAKTQNKAEWVYLIGSQLRSTPEILSKLVKPSWTNYGTVLEMQTQGRLHNFLKEQHLRMLALLSIMPCTAFFTKIEIARHYIQELKRLLNLNISLSETILKSLDEIRRSSLGRLGSPWFTEVVHQPSDEIVPSSDEV